MDAFDPYHKWLGIPPAEQPPHHYRLLGIALFESDPDVIEAAADRQMAYVSQCATGQYLKQSQQLLNELSAARICLLVAARKQAYDAQLKIKLHQSSQIENSMVPVPLSEPEPDVFLNLNPPAQPVAVRKRTKRKSQEVKTRPKPALPVWVWAAPIGLVAILGVWSLFGRSSKPSSRIEHTPVPNLPVASKPTAVEGANSAGTATPPQNPRSTPSKTPSREILRLEILDARYGARDTWVDLTDRVRTASKSGILGIAVDSGLMGSDPAFGVSKWLKLRYRLGAQQHEHVVPDYHSLVLLDTREKPSVDANEGLRILEAHSGGNIFGEGNWTDVTERVRSHMQNGELRVSVNDIIAGLPQQRMVIVRWSVFGQVWTSPFASGDTILLGSTLPAVVNLKAHQPQAASAESSLVVLEAQFGAVGQSVDMTDRVRESARRGFVAFVGDTIASQGDPAPGVTKRTRLRYLLDGHSFDQVYHEGSFIYVDGRTKPPEAGKSGMKVLQAICGHGLLGEEIRGQVKMIDVTRHLQREVENNSLPQGLDSLVQDVAGDINPKRLLVRYSVDGDIFLVVFDQKMEVQLEKY